MPSSIEGGRGEGGGVRVGEEGREGGDTRKLSMPKYSPITMQVALLDITLWGGGGEGRGGGGGGHRD